MKPNFTRRAIEERCTGGDKMAIEQMVAAHRTQLYLPQLLTSFKIIILKALSKVH